jgi:hypothetical protein
MDRQPIPSCIVSNPKICHLFDNIRNQIQPQKICSEQTMQELFPKSPFIPAARQHSLPACEWVMPAPAAQRCDYFSTCKVLPAGMPDCLQVSIDHSKEGIDRCTAVIYGSHAYVIHYEFKISASVHK